VTRLDERRHLGAALPEPAAGPARRAGIVAAVGIPTVLVGLHALGYGRWIVDDAAITFAYARSVATGEGPVLQPGAEPVEGFSNPAWLGLLVLGRWLGLFDRGAWFGVPDYVAFPKLLALACCAGMFACYYAVARVVTSRGVLVTVVAGAVTAAVPSFVIWIMSGLENALLALATAAIAAVLVRAAVAGRLLEPTPAVLCGLLAALAALTRPDGLIYAGAYPVAVLLLSRGGLGRVLVAAATATAAFAVPTALYLAWRVATFGAYLPNTALAKSQGLPALSDLNRPAELVGYAGWLTTALAVLLIGAALATRSPGRPGLVALLVPLGLAVAAFAVLEPDWMGHHRFATPVWALGALAATAAASRVWPMLAVRGRTAVTVIAVAAAALTVTTFVDTARDFRATPTAPLCVVAQNAGRNITGYAEIIGQRDATLLAPDVGGAALVGPVRIIDLAGLANARIAGYWAEEDWPGLRDYVFDEARPTFIKSHGPWSSVTGLTADPRLASDYAEIGSTSGSTDWVRVDALDGSGELERLRTYFTGVAAPAHTAARRAPRASCGDRLAP
jgi:hypothetical protein